MAYTISDDLEILRYYKSILIAWCDVCNLGDDDELKLLNAGSYDGRSPIALATPPLARASPNPQPHLFRIQAPRALNAPQPNAPAPLPCVAIAKYTTEPL